jgi:hypothetical protein
VGDANLSVMVPRTWAKHVSNQDWQPPGANTGLDAIRATAGTDGATPGVFIGVLPGDRLPDIPSHTECGLRGQVDTLDVDGRPAVTRLDGDCGDGTYLLERVVQVDTKQQLWIQVRAKDRSTAFDVANGYSYTAADAR